MKKTTFLSVLLGCTLFAGGVFGATAAQAQTYVYPVTPSIYPVASACTSFTVYQQLGSSDNYTAGQVTALQQLLNREGYLSGVTGYFDNGTFGAVVNFQRAHGIYTTGTVGPLTRATLSQESCTNGYNGGYYPNPIAPLPPVIVPPVYVPQISNNCSWTNGFYQCNNSNYQNQNCPYSSNGYYSNSNGNYSYGCNTISLSSFTTNTTNTYNGNITTITMRGSGFSPNGNTVRFDSLTIPNVASIDGSSLTFTVPASYYAGTYQISVANSLGLSSNSLPYTINNLNNCYYNNGYNNNCSNSYQNSYQSGLNLSSISGQTSNISSGSINTWTVTASDQNNQNMTITTVWGDGSANDVQQSYSNGQRTFSLSHVYYTPGTYTMRVTATDSSGYSAYSTLTVTVYGNGYYRSY